MEATCRRGLEGDADAQNLGILFEDRLQLNSQFRVARPALAQTCREYFESCARLLEFVVDFARGGGRFSGGGLPRFTQKRLAARSQVKREVGGQTDAGYPKREAAADPHAIRHGHDCNHRTRKGMDSR